MYLAGNVEGWGDPVCTSRRFNAGGKTNCVSFMSQEVKEQKQHDLTKNEFCEEQGECDDDVKQASDQ